MWSQFFLQNAHFAINLFAALVFFAVFWLYYDAWHERKSTSGLWRLIGLLLLSVSFLIHAASVESSIVVSPIFTSAIQDVLVAATRIPGFILLILSLLSEPLQPRPREEQGTGNRVQGIAMVGIGSHFLYPVLAVLVGQLYLRRATAGLEDHLKPVALAFYILAISELFGVGTLFAGSANLAIFDATAPFGPVWLVEHALLLASSLVLGRWIFGYLLKQFSVQLFMILTTTIIAIFLLTTVAFTGLLVRNIEGQTLAELETDVRVLAYTIDSKKSEVLSDAQVASQNPQIIAATRDSTRKTLADLTETILLAKKESTLVITSDSGLVLARGEDRDRAGDSLSDDPLVKRALMGQSATSVVSRTGVVAPSLFIYGASPIRDGATIVGAVLTGTAIDPAFVDGMKTATGLESAIYGDTVVSATTISSAGGARFIGMKLNRPDISGMVMGKNQKYSGTVTLANTPYFGAFLPLTDVDNNPVGMLLVAKPQRTTLSTAGRSIELTFLVTIALLAISIVPAHGIAKYIGDQI